MLNRMLCRRFVGWITNFIHNRKDPDINMVRGYLTSTVGRSVAPDRMEAIRLRARANAGPAETRGFLSTSSDVLEQEGTSVAGSGEIRYKKHSRRPQPHKAKIRAQDTASPTPEGRDIRGANGSSRLRAAEKGVIPDIRCFF